MIRLPNIGSYDSDIFIATPAAFAGSLGPINLFAVERGWCPTIHQNRYHGIFSCSLLSSSIGDRYGLPCII
jgi:hypothetical protein